MNQHKATILEALHNMRVHYPPDWFDEIDAALSWVQTWGEARSLDAPDVEGYWAFTGTLELGSGMAHKERQHVCKVFMFYGALTAWVLERGIWSIARMNGKWTRLHMPWSEE